MPDFDTSVPHIARVYDYWLGGKDNFAADRELGEHTLAAYPNLVYSVRANRTFLVRAVRFLAGDGDQAVPGHRYRDPHGQQHARGGPAGGAGEPDRLRDNDPIVLSHAKALLKSNRQGACAYLDADLRDPEAILAAAAGTLDFSQPVAVMLIAVMHFVATPGQRDRAPADGRVRAGQLRDHLARGQRHRRQAADRDGTQAERVRGRR